MVNEKICGDKSQVIGIPFTTAAPELIVLKVSKYKELWMTDRARFEDIMRVIGYNTSDQLWI